MKLLASLFSLLLLAQISYSQSFFITAANSSYNTSVPPEENIGYGLVNACNSRPDTCTYSWSVTNGSIIGPSSGKGLQIVLIKWYNVNATGSISVSTSNCTASCNTSVNYSVPIRYLGDPGNIKINGTAYTGSYEIACGTISLTFSVDPATNATQHCWTFPSGWTASSSCGTSIVVTPTANTGGTVSVTASRSDISHTTSKSLVITRPANPALGASISGNYYLCTGSNSYSVSSLPSGTTVSWSSSNTGVLTINSSTGVATKTGNGLATIFANLTNDCGTITKSFGVRTSTPATPYIEDGLDYVCVNDLEEYMTDLDNDLTYTWSIVGGYVQSGQGTWKARIKWTTSGTGIIYLYTSNTCGTSSTSTFYVSVDNCGARIATNNDSTKLPGTSYHAKSLSLDFPTKSIDYIIAPNPIKGAIVIPIENTELLPQAVSVYSETKLNAIISLSAPQIKNNVGIKNSKIVINTSGLLPGIYYVHLLNKEGHTKKIRVLIE